MIRVYSALKYYNANTRHVQTGDCVKRALAVAFRRDYDEVSRSLNRIKNAINAPRFNSMSVIRQYLSSEGVSLENAPQPYLTVAEFAESVLSGTYLCLTGNENKTAITHMLCIVDSDVYDSWDSMNQTVRQFC